MKKYGITTEISIAQSPCKPMISSNLHPDCGTYMLHKLSSRFADFIPINGINNLTKSIAHPAREEEWWGEGARLISEIIAGPMYW